MGYIPTAEQYSGAADARTRHPGHRGIAAAIREHLARGARTAEQLVAAMGGCFTDAQVRGGLSQMVNVSRNVFISQDKPARYALQPFPREAAPATIVPPRYVPEFRSLTLAAHDAHANWRMCERDPYETSNSAVRSHKGCA